jgi:hypothetical protein
MTRWMAIGILLVLAGCSSVPSGFKPVNPIPAAEFSHHLFEETLAAHVKDGLVDYPAIATDDRFAGYLTRLDLVDPDTFPTRNERLVFWINAYNAFAIKGILEGYSPVSWVGRYRYFIGREHRVGGTTINLYDLERQVLIRQFHEPLIHFAIVCASASCPRLQPWTYQANQLDRQLDLAARAFINDPTRNRFDRARKVASLSKIFDWFAEDFGAAAGSTLAYVARYVGDPELAKDLIESEYRIEYLDYDWTLNGIPPKEVARGGAS